MPVNTRSQSRTMEMNDAAQSYFDEKFKLLATKDDLSGLLAMISANQATIKTLEENQDRLKDEVKQNRKDIQELRSLLKDANAKIEEAVDDIDYRTDALEFKTDALEQYGRRVSLRLNDVPKPAGETQDDLQSDVIERFREMDVNIEPSDIERIHRIGKTKNGSSESSNTVYQQIIIKFKSWNKRCDAYKGKYVAKEKKLSTKVNLDLTATRFKLLSTARQKLSMSLSYVYADINCRLVFINIMNKDKKNYFSSMYELEKFIGGQRVVLDDAPPKSR